MSDLLTILFLVSLLCLVVGIIRPTIFRRIFKSRANRRTVGLVFIGSSLLLLILVGLTSRTAPSSPSVNQQEPVSYQPIDSWETNDIWAGYLKKGQNFTYISGQWTVPHIRATEDLRTSVAWIGIGGWNSQNLLQIGTLHFKDRYASVYYAFTERYPLEPANIKIPNFKVSPGDKVSASITKKKSGTWLLTIDNLSTNKHFKKTVKFRPDQYTAEWIVEWATPDKYKLVRFKNFSFSKMAFEGETTKLTSNDRLKMIKGKKVLVEPSKLGADGQSFELTYTGD